MKSIAIGVAVLCLSVPGSHAQADAAKRAKVEQLFTVMRLDHTMDQIMTAIQQQTSAVLRSAPGYAQMTPQQKRISQQFQSKVMALATQSVGWKAMEPEMVTLYASTYSEQEIDGLLAFYKSPVGQTMLEKTPELTQKSMAIAQQRAGALQPRLQQLLVEFTKEYEAASPAKPAGSRTPAGSAAH